MLNAKKVATHTKSSQKEMSKKREGKEMKVNKEKERGEIRGKGTNVETREIFRAKCPRNLALVSGKIWVGE